MSPYRENAKDEERVETLLESWKRKANWLFNQYGGHFFIATFIVVIVGGGILAWCRDSEFRKTHHCIKWYVEYKEQKCSDVYEVANGIRTKIKSTCKPIDPIWECAKYELTK